MRFTNQLETSQPACQDYACPFSFNSTTDAFNQDDKTRVMGRLHYFQDEGNFYKPLQNHQFDDHTNLTSGSSAWTVTQGYAPGSHKNSSTSSGDFGTENQGSGHGGLLFEVKRTGLPSTSSSEPNGSSGEPGTTGGGGPSDYYFKRVRTPVYSSNGSDSSSWDRTKRNALSHLDALNPLTVDQDNEDPVYEVATDYHRLSHSGGGDETFDSNYRLKTTIPDDIAEYFTRVTGIDDGLDSPSEIVTHYNLQALEELEDEVTVQDNTQSRMNVTEDGIFFTTDGLFQVTTTQGGKWHNPNPISTTETTNFSGGLKTLHNLIAANELQIESASTDIRTVNYEGFGIKATLTPPETQSGDVLNSIGVWPELDLQPVGKRTTTDHSQGNSEIRSQSQATETREFTGLDWFYSHQHRPNSTVTSNWNLTDITELEYLADGGATLVYTPSGTLTTHRALSTAGEYQWRNDREMISGPYAGGVARNWGESNYHSHGHFQHGMARSGSISASFDDEGNAVSASGSLLVAETFGGQATSHITAWGKSVLGSQSGTGGMVVATRDFTQDRTGGFQGSRISTVTPLLGSDGSLSFETLEGELTGTRSGSQTTSDIRSVYELHNGTVATHGNLFAVTDSGEAPAGGGGASQVYLLPPTQMANDPQPEVDVSLSTSGGLGYFSSAFGFLGGIVGASFATALPGDPSLPNSTTFGDQILANDGWLQEPGQPNGDHTTHTNPYTDDILFSLRVPAKVENGFFKTIRVEFGEASNDSSDYLLKFAAGYSRGYFEDGLMGDVDLIRSAPSSIASAFNSALGLMITTTPTDRAIMMAEYAQDAAELTPELAEFGSMLHKARNGQFESFTEGEREKFLLLTSIANEVLGAVREELGNDLSPELVGRIVGFLAYEITVTALVAGVGSLVATPTGGAGIALFRSMAVVTTKLKKLGPLGIKIAKAIETGALTARIQKGLKAPRSGLFHGASDDVIRYWDDYYRIAGQSGDDLTKTIADLKRLGFDVRAGDAASFRTGTNILEYGPNTKVWELYEEAIHHSVAKGLGQSEISALTGQLRSTFRRTRGNSPAAAAEEIFVKSQLLRRVDLDAATRHLLTRQIEKLRLRGLVDGY